MANDKKFSRTLLIDSKADFSNLIKEIDKVKKHFEKDANVKGTQDVLSIGPTLEKIKDLLVRLDKLREKGFSSPKEVKEYEKTVELIVKLANNLDIVFDRLNSKSLNKASKEAVSNYEKAKNNVANLEKNLNNVLKTELKGVNAEKDYNKEILDSIDDAKKLANVEKEIYKWIDELVKAKKAAKTTAENSISSLYKEANNGKAFTAGAFVGNKAGAMAAARDAFNSVIKRSTTNTSSDTAFENFKKALGDTYLLTAKAEANFKKIFKNLFDVNSGDAGKALKELLKGLNEEIDNLTKKKESLKNFFQSDSFNKLITDLKEGRISVEQFKEKVDTANQKVESGFKAEPVREFGEALKNDEKSAELLNNTLEDTTNKLLQFDNLSDSISNFATRILSITTAFETFRRIVKQTFTDVKNLDKAFGNIAMVTSYSVDQMWEQYSTYASMANKLGQTTQSVIEASGLYYQQGLKTAEVMSLTEETMKLATLAGLDFKDATSQMTGAIRAFKLEMTDGAHVTDVYASLAANAAADVNGISEAMSATAAIAHSAGMQFETTAAMLTTMIEATQEAPKNLGTAMKAIIARFTELKENVAGTADSEFEDLDYNKVDKALKSVGISLKDATGLFRNLDDVFLELSEKWNTLERNTQRYIATIAAGSRQQSRFIALMENYERTSELIDVATNSAGKANQLFDKFSDTLEYKINRFKNALEQTKTTIFNSEFYKDLVDTATVLVEKLEGLNWLKLLIAVPAAIAAGRLMGKQWISGFKNALSNGQGLLSSKIRISGLEDTLKNYNTQLGKFTELTGIKKEDITRINKNSEIIKSYDTAIDNQLKKLNVLEKDTEEYKQAWKDYDVLTDSKENFEKSVKELHKSLAITSAAKNVGAALGTAITMGMMGTFNADLILGVISGLSLITGLSLLLSGNFIGAGISAGISVASLGIKGIVSLIESDIEKQRELNDLAYKYSKIIELDEEAQKSLNDAYTKANNEFEKLKELYESFTEAKNIYEELSNKILLTEEELEKLNNATLTLADLHPELVLSYNDLKQAILKVGKAWDLVVLSEEDYYYKLKKNSVDAEALVLIGEYKLAYDYKKLSQGLILDKQELYKKQNKYYANKPFALADAESQLLSIDEILNMSEWDTNFEGIFDDAESYIENLISGPQSNMAFAEAFLKAANTVMNASYKTAEDAYKAVFKEDNEDKTWGNIAKLIQEEIDSWANLDIENVDDSKLKLAASNMSSLLQSNLDIYLRDFKGSEESKKLLENLLIKRLGSAEEIGKILLKGLDDKKIFNLDDVTERILSDNSDLVSLLEKVTPYLTELISEFYSNLGIVTTEESEKFLNKLRVSGVGQGIIDALSVDLGDSEKLGQELFEKIERIFGHGFSESNLGKLFNRISLKSKNALLNNLANYSDAQAGYITHGMEAFLKENNLSENSSIFNYLSGILWYDKSIVDLGDLEKEFIEFAKTVNISTELAKLYWNSYKTYMMTTGAIDISKTINPEAIAESIDEKIAKKLEAKNGITSAISTALKNGFLNFTESLLLEEACDALGLKVQDYLTKTENGYSLDIFKLREDIANSFSEENIRKEVEAAIDLRKELLQNTKAYLERLNTTEKLIKAEEENLKILEAEAAAVYAILHGGSVSGWEGLGLYSSEALQINYDFDASGALDSINEELKSLEESGEEWDKIWDKIEYRLKISANEFLTDIDNVIAKHKEDLDKYFEDLENADKKVTDLTTDLQKKIKDLQKAYKAWQESLYGSAIYESKLGPLNNYEEILDSITRKANRAKEALDDLQANDNVSELLNTYANSIHDLTVTKKAENQVIKMAMSNAEKVLSLYSDYWYKVGDSYLVNYATLNAAKIPDLLKNEIEDQVKLLRDWTKQIEDNDDDLRKLEKEFNESRKQALLSYVNLEKEVVETLKEQYEKEIDDLQKKYDAMSDADLDYLDALEKAIDKERLLRDRLNEWNDLATKEKKLSLMQRDTSGSNQLEILKLLQDIEQDRTKLLDNSVDDIINSLKEMYDLQKETRDAELEYMNSMLDNAELIKQANEIISGWLSSADAVNWFMEAKDLNAMSAAELELEKDNWEKLYKAKELYEELSKLKFDEYLQATLDEINKKMLSISETVTTYSLNSMTLIKEKILEALDAALEAYNSSIIATKNAKDALKEAEKLLAELQDKLPDSMAELMALMLLDIYKMYQTVDSIETSNSTKSNITSTYIANSAIGSEAARYYLELGQSKIIPTSIIGDEKLKQELSNYISISKTTKRGMIITDPSELLSLIINSWSDDKKNELLSLMKLKGYFKDHIIYAYKEGGLVNYTGPAWVDGSPSAPEAFLNPEDTRRIGEAAKLLADLPILNGGISLNISTSTVGDTTIALTVNFDSISEEYDAERVIDLMKEKIVEAARYTGSNVILQQ